MNLYRDLAPQLQELADKWVPKLRAIHGGPDGDLVPGGCPDCICDPTLCAGDDTGQYCVEAGCGACQHGCPTDEHDMTIRAMRETL